MFSEVVEAKNICLSIGDMTLTSDNCYIKSASVNILNTDIDVYRLGSSAPIKVKGPPPMCSIELTLITTDMSFSFTAEESKQIRYKKVEDCSPQELLFAARMKLEGKDK